MRVSSALRSTAIAVAATALVNLGHPASASPESSALIDEGVVQLERGAWNEALVKFLAASVADPADAEAQFFQGVALNRLGLAEQALSQLQKARAAGFTNPAMEFEYGWALLGTGRFNDALSSLQAYKAANPESAKASELMGRAHLALGETDAAEEAFAQAVRLDPGLKTSVDFFRANRIGDEGNPREAARLLDDAIASDPDNPLARGLARHRIIRGVLAPPPEFKRWTVFGATAIGRNSNVITLSDEIARPQDISRTDSRYFDISAGGRYILPIDVDKSVSVGGALAHRNYRDISGKDTDTIGLFARYDQNILPALIGSLTASYAHSRVDGDAFSKTSGLSAALNYQVNSRMDVTVAWSSQRKNLPEPTANATSLDRDSKLHTFGGSIHIEFPSLDSEIRFGGKVLNNSAEGSDYDYHAYNFHIGGETELPWELTLGLNASRTSYDYKNLNSLAPTTPPGPTGFGFAREDAVTTYSIDLTRPINDNVTGFIRAYRTNSNSNLNVFTYDQKDIQIGVTAQF